MCGRIKSPKIGWEMKEIAGELSCRSWKNVAGAGFERWHTPIIHFCDRELRKPRQRLDHHSCRKEKMEHHLKLPKGRQLLYAQRSTRNCTAPWNTSVSLTCAGKHVSLNAMISQNICKLRTIKNCICWRQF